MATWNNTVPQGVAGTGNAVIYGANPVSAQFGNQLAQLRERERRDLLIQQKQAEELANKFRENQLAASEGRLWADQVGQLEQGHIQKGIELKQRGIDPYGVSKEALEYQKERRAVQAQQGYRKATEARLNDTIKLIQANPDKYEPEDIKAVNDFFEKTKLQDAYSGNLALPQLRERFSPNTLLKDVKAITQNDVDVKGNIKSDRKFLDRESTQNAIIGRLSSDPRGVQYLNKITGGIPVQQIMSIPKTIEANRNDIIKEYNGNPQLRQKLATDAGIVGEGEKFNQWVDEMARVRASARNTFDNQMENFVANASQGVMLWDRETPDTTLANLALREKSVNIAQQNANRLASEASGSGDGGADTPKDLTLYYGTDGKEAVTSRGTVLLSKPGQSMQGSVVYDLSANTFEPIKESASKYEMVSIGNYPLAKAQLRLPDGKIIPKGGLVGDNFAKGRPDLITWTPRLLVTSDGYQYLADPKVLPKNKLTKKEEVILSKFKPYSQPATSPTKPATVTKTGTFIGIPKGGKF